MSLHRFDRQVGIGRCEGEQCVNGALMLQDGWYNVVKFGGCLHALDSSGGHIARLEGCSLECPRWRRADRLREKASGRLADVSFAKTPLGGGAAAIGREDGFGWMVRSYESPSDFWAEWEEAR